MLIYFFVKKLLIQWYIQVESYRLNQMAWGLLLSIRMMKVSNDAIILSRNRPGTSLIESFVCMAGLRKSLGMQESSSGKTGSKIAQSES